MDYNALINSQLTLKSHLPATIASTISVSPLRGSRYLQPGNEVPKTVKTQQ
jgi:hypothetical protein